MKWKKTLFFIFFIVAGIIVGALVASLTQSIPFLSWLSFGKSIGISTGAPMLIDLSVMKIAFGFELGINVSQIIFITISLLIYKAIFGKI